MAIQFVGSASGGNGSAATPYAVSLTALSGGIGSAPITGDFVLVFTGFATDNNGDPGVASPTATEVADLYVNDTNDANLSVSYFFAGASPPTSISVNGSGNSTHANSTSVMVFRGVNPTTPLDVVTTTNAGASSNTASPPSITPVSANTVIVLASLIATASAGTVTIPAGYTGGLLGSGTGSGKGSSVRAAYKANPTAGVVDNPGNMTCSNGGAGSSWAAATVVLRPALGGNIKFWNGSAWVVKPVKYWNGSAWTTKPLKRWNGSAWVVTNY
jgi:hypothetical protein